ncbi:MAG: Clp protease ClpP [Rhizobiaceae bacterium]|nr:Clp protease ClpP [Rhizobiaceae bacterium]
MRRIVSPIMMSADVVPFRRMPKAQKIGRYEMKKTASDRGEILLYGLIGQDWFGDGNTSKGFANDLKALGDVKTIDLRIDSEGGDVFTGKAIYSLLNEHKAEVIVHVDGLAASAASFIAMVGNTIEMAEGAFMMIHDCWSFAIGNAAEMRKTADLLDKVNDTIIEVYVARTGSKDADIRQWMADETWMTAKECVKRGFADKVNENLKVAAAIRDPSLFKNLPAALRPNRNRAAAAIAALRRA